MNKTVEFIPSSDRYGRASFRIEMAERAYGGPKKKRQFTVSRSTLLRAIREAGLEQIKYVEHETTLDQDIAMHHALSATDSIPGRSLTDSSRAKKSKLYDRIIKRMGLE